MEKKQPAGQAQKQEMNWKTGGLWIAAAVLIVLVLMPLFNLIWVERTEAHTRQECELIAEALLKQSVNDVRSVSERIRNIRQQK